MDKLLALLAFVVFTGFVAILAIKVPSPDLVIIVAFTVLLVAYDFWSALRNDRS